MILRLAALAIGYLFGTFQTGYIFGKLKGVDIRNYGSGNTGATNSLRTFGWRGGVVTFVGDCLKAILAIVVVKMLFGESFEGNVRILELYAGMGAVLGHNFPFYLKFKGGKGIACTLAVAFAVCPGTVPVCLTVFFLCLALSRYVSLGSILMVLLFMIQVFVFNFYGVLGMTGNEVIEFNILAVIFCTMAIVRHKANIVRLINGTENKIGQKAEKKEGCEK